MSKGFLKILAITIIVIVSLVLVTIVVSAIKISNSDAYDFAKEQILINDKTIDRIGEIKSFGRFPSGKLRKNEAQIETNVSGTKSEARIILILEKNEINEWVVLNYYFKELK